MEPDFYEVLGVSRSASAEDIKRAFRQIARSCHPDVAQGDADAEARFMAARKAYETLKDPSARAVYDGRAPTRPGFDAFWRASQRRQQAGSGRVRARSGLHDPANSVSLDDLVVETIHVQAGRPGGKTSERDKTSERPRERAMGPAVEREVEVGVVTALRGGRVSVDTPAGSVHVTVPGGTSGGARLRLRGKGGPGRDLIVTVRIRVPSTLSDEARRLVERLAELPEFR
ncbi:MAG: DnaJ domain-containing protein [Myxococcales bacterium]|nr:DnaJ domain-containing protein [Myxococcales bacterium]